jgi:hypothetical protein
VVGEIPYWVKTSPLLVELHRVEDGFVAVLNSNAPAQFVAVDQAARIGLRGPRNASAFTSRLRTPYSSSTRWTRTSHAFLLRRSGERRPRAPKPSKRGDLLDPLINSNRLRIREHVRGPKPAPSPPSAPASLDLQIARLTFAASPIRRRLRRGVGGFWGARQ